jgi:hypothetical protein
MRTRVVLLLAAVAAAGGNAGAAPPEAAPAECPAGPVLPPELAGWAQAGSSATMREYDATRAAEGPALGAQRTALSLHEGSGVAYRIAPEKAPAAGKWGGTVPVAVERAGTLVVALDKGAWIDLVRDGAAVASAGHGHGPACSGIRKMVEYKVTPGRYLLQISGAPDPIIQAMAVLHD